MDENNDEWVRMMMDMIGQITGNPAGRKMNDILSPENLAVVLLGRRSLALYSSLDETMEPMNEMEDIESNYCKQWSPEFIRGIMMGITLSLEADLRDKDMVTLRSSHIEMCNIYTALENLLMEGLVGDFE
tara:strand:- start:17635 stop:18024 length:390 start_codon:yes stop_codon:yes gene_type:complete